MKYPKRSLAPSLIVAVVVLLTCFCVYLVHPIGVDGGSTDIKHKRKNEEKISASFHCPDSDESIQVVIQLNHSPSPQLNALLRRAGVHIKGDFKQLS